MKFLPLTSPGTSGALGALRFSKSWQFIYKIEIHLHKNNFLRENKEHLLFRTVVKIKDHIYYIPDGQKEWVLGVVIHTCNPRYMGGVSKIVVPRPAWLSFS